MENAMSLSDLHRVLFRKASFVYDTVVHLGLRSAQTPAMRCYVDFWYAYLLQFSC